MKNPCRDMMEKIKVPDSLKNKVLDAAYTAQSPVTENTQHQPRQRTLDTQILNKTGRKKVVKKKFPIVLAAVIAALGVTAAAAAYIIQWNDKLAERFGANEQQQSELASAGAVASVDQTVTENGLTVTALQTLGDKNGIYLLFDVKAPEGVTLSDTNLFEGTDVEIEGISGGVNRSGGFMSDADTSASPSGQANERYYMLWLSNAKQEEWNNKKITASFSNLQADKGKLDMYTVLEGEWKLSWTLSYSDETQTFEINQSYDIAGHEVLVESIDLSPLSMTLNLGGAGLNALIDDAGLDELGVLLMPSLTLSGGTNFDSIAGASNEKWAKSGQPSYKAQFNFDKVLDVSKVSGITLNFPMEKADNTLTITLP